MFRGREITHKELGSAILEDVIKDTKDVGQVEMAPRMEGRQMFMILSPNAKVAQRARELARAKADAERKENEKELPKKPVIKDPTIGEEHRRANLAAREAAAAAAAAAGTPPEGSADTNRPATPPSPPASQAAKSRS